MGDLSTDWTPKLGRHLSPGLGNKESLLGETYLVGEQRTALLGARLHQREGRTSGSAHLWQSELRARRPVLQVLGLHRHLAVALRK